MKNEMNAERAARYVTARALVACAEFAAGDYVSIKFWHMGDNGEAWFLINRSQHGALRNEVAYPASHLTSFCL